MLGLIASLFVGLTDSSVQTQQYVLFNESNVSGDWSRPTVPYFPNIKYILNVRDRVHNIDSKYKAGK